MISKGKQLVVVSLVEGRNFPRRPRFHLVAEAKFDGEVLATDPVHHDDRPQIEQELGWSLDRKALHQYRLQRTAIRVQFYAVDAHTTAKETVGYVTLDLRSATESKALRWSPLLHSRYAKREGVRSVRPEVEIGIYLDEDLKELGPSIGARPIGADIEPVLNEQEGYYQLGNYKICNERFVISITVANAKNLTQLIPSEVNLTSAGTGFYFHFHLMNSPVVNEPFADLLRPNFPAERSSVRVRSSLEVLRSYFSGISPLRVFLSCGQQVLGVSEIPVTGLFKEGADFSQPVSIEGVFALHPPNLPTVEGEQASVGVSVTLRRELPQPVMKPMQKLGKVVKPTPVKPHTPPQRASPFTVVVPDAVEPVVVRRANPPRKGPRSPVVELEKEEPEKEEEEEEEEEEELHRFCFTLDIHSVRDVNFCDSQARNVFVRYIYPFFGSSTPVMTHPSVTVGRHQEAQLPQGLCEFELAVAPSALRQQLFQEPLCLELRERDRERASLELLGTALLDLSRLLTSGELSEALPVLATEETEADGDAKEVKVAELVVRAALVDLGAMEAAPQQERTPNRAHKAPKAKPRTPDLRRTAEYRAAVELELWKQSAEEEFQKKLSAECNRRLKSISSEWQKREKEREMLIKKKTAELQSLKTELEATSRDLENREKQMGAKEAELARLRADLQREHERKLAEVRDAARRLEQEAEHRVAIERQKARHLTEQLEQSRTEAQEWERRFRASDKELQRTRERAASTPEARLQSELALAASERSELERRAEAAVAAKERYKAQYVSALRELARVRKRERAREAEGLRRKERELSHLRLRHLAAEERALQESCGERRAEDREMAALRGCIEKLREETQAALGQLREKDKDSGHDSPLPSTEMTEYLQQLMRVRESLLKDSLYDPNDLVVQELEQRIREARAESKCG